MSPLDRDELARALSDGRWFDAASMIARLAPAPVPSLAEAEWRDAPRAPALYVPKVGDVVRGLYGDDTLACITYVAPNGRMGRATGFRLGMLPDSTVAFPTYLRPATAAERVAAGLDAAPASVPTPAIDPRRTVGAVVKWYAHTFIVVSPGEGPGVMRSIDDAKDGALVPSSVLDAFLRWATREECERHGIPYVDRTAPASKPVDREGLAKAIRRAWWGADGEPSPPWETIRRDERDDWLSAADAAIAYMKGGAS